MRVFALSDIHVDYDDNAAWVDRISTADHRDDVLILAGDVSHKPALLAWCLRTLAARFAQVLFVPGNHDLWVLGEDPAKTSLRKFDEVCAIARDEGVSMASFHRDGLSIVPLLGWYDYSFGTPDDTLVNLWMDYRACRWPEGFDAARITEHFLGLNRLQAPPGHRVITFSHFLPRLDLVPPYVPAKHRILDPVLGSVRLEQQLRTLSPAIHVYGHSHINRSVRLDGVHYINNAFAYPQEDSISLKRLLCIDEG